MKSSVFSGIISVAFLLSLAGCTSTKITAPSIADKGVKTGIPLKIEYKNLPGEDSIALLAPSGRKSGVPNDTGRLDSIMVSAIEKIVTNKGYAVRDNAGTVLTVDFTEFGIYWSSGPTKGSGSYKADVKHFITPKNSGNKLWKWDYSNEKQYGKLPGNCLAGCAGLTIIGVIPFMIYVNSQGGTEGAQMTRGGNELLADYLEKFDAALPGAGTVVK